MVRYHELTPYIALVYKSSAVHHPATCREQRESKCLFLSYSLSWIFKKILEFFNELKTLYSYDQKQELILFNNKELLFDGKPIFLNEWF